MKNPLFLVPACLAALAVSAGADCPQSAARAESAIDAQPAKLLEVVDREVAAAPDCSCEIVKAAIQASEADAEGVASIVETAASAAPEQTRLIVQCALAVAPEALDEVQKVVARLEKSRQQVGYSAKEPASAKAPKAPIEVKPAWNPLNFPGEGPVGPIAGGPGGFPLLPPDGIIIPPVIVPPSVTPVGFPNPGNVPPGFPDRQPNGPGNGLFNGSSATVE